MVGLSSLFRGLALGVLSLVVVIAFGLSATALWFHLPDGINIVAAVVLMGLGLGLVGAALVVRARRKMLFGAAITIITLTLVWWVQVSPRNDREWAPELAQSVTADIDGSQVTLSNIRNFNWRSTTDYDARWENQTYDIDKLDSVDAALSYWGIDKIAHVLISFGFEDGEQIVFSVEIRKELGEEFSELGGLFKQFEMSLIAAKEEDILYLRTNARDPLEDVYLYPLKVTPDARRALFLSYAQLANNLADEPYWYNTITANCTTVVYRLVRSFSPDRSFDLRFVLSGGLPEYFAEYDMLDWSVPLGDFRARAAISARAQAMQVGDNYSRVIRDE